MWLCILSGKQFEDAFENSQWGKTKQCNHLTYDTSNLRAHLKPTVEKVKKCNQCILSGMQFENAQWGNQTNATNVIIHPMRRAV